MANTRQASRPRCLVVAAVAAAGYAALGGWLLPTVGTQGAATFDAVLVRVCADVALAAGGWLWLATTVTVLAAVRGREHHAVGVPAPLRRAVLAACGVALTGTLMAAAPAHATPGPQHEDRVAPAPSVLAAQHEDRVAPAPSVLAGLPLPDRAVAPAAATPPIVVVAPGDTLWAIAARSLGSGADDAAIDAAWRRLYDLNRAEIGPDPDLIRPAQRLEVLP